MKKLVNSRFFLVAMVVAVVGIAGATGATAAQVIGSKQIQDDSIKSRDIRDDTVRGKDIRDGAVHLQDLNGSVRGMLGQPQQGGVQPPALNGGLVDQVTGTETVAHLGGSFKTGATVFTDTLDLPKAGTYQVNAYGFFDTTNGADTLRTDGTHLMLAIRDQGTGEFGNDFGTCFTGAFPDGDREATCQSVRTITVTGPTTLYVKAFGYNDDQSGTGSGEFTVSADVSAVQVG